MANTYNRLGTLLTDTGRPTDAEAVFRDALALCKSPADEVPGRREFRQDLASTHNNLGVLFRNTGREQDGEAAYRAALAIRKQLVAEFSARLKFRRELASGHNKGTGSLQA